MALLPTTYRPLIDPRLSDGFEPVDMSFGVLPSGMPAMAATAADAPAGFQFMTDRGRQAGYGSNPSGFIAADPNAQYRLWDERGKNRIVAQGTGAEALQQIYDTANQFNEEQGKKANWGIERLNPTTGKWERVAENDPSRNVLGKVADIALPIAGALLAPATFGTSAALGAALGSGLSSVAQGRSLGDTALRAAITGATTFGAGKLGAAIGPAAGSTAGGVGGSAAGSALGAGTMAATGAKLAGLLPGIVVSGTGGALGAGLGAGLGSAAGAVGGSALGGLAAGGGAPTSRDPVTGELVVTGGRLPTSGVLPGAVGAGASGLAFDPVTGELNQIFIDRVNQMQEDPVGSGTEAAAAAAAEAVGNPITVEGKRQPQRDESGVGGPLGAGAGALAGALAGAGAAAAPSTPKDVQDAFDKEFGQKNSLIDDIIKYYSLGSIGAEALGGLLGGGGGGAGQMGSYASQLGPMPNFSRGAFTPFTGDYETYGFGPEFNFFGGQPTPTAPAMGILPPATQPGSGVV